MTTKIDAHRIEYQLNVRMFVWDCNILIKSKLKQIKKINSKSTKYLRMKLIIIIIKKGIQPKGKKWKMEFFFKRELICIVIKLDPTCQPWKRLTQLFV